MEAKCEVVGCKRGPEYGLRLLQGQLVMPPTKDYEPNEASWHSFKGEDLVLEPLDACITLCDEHFELICQAVQDVLGRKLTEVKKRDLAERHALSCTTCAWWQLNCYGPAKQRCPPDKPFAYYERK